MSTDHNIESGPAIFSPDKLYRYTLERSWGRAQTGSRAVFIGLNPSTADERTLDPTLRRCVNFCITWGYTQFTMLNLFAFRATDPKRMMKVRRPVGDDNDKYIKQRCRGAGIIVCAWSAMGDYLNRGHIVREMLGGRYSLYHLGLTANGEPKHPLYLPSNVEPILWDS
jgi:hypothetical protein